MTLYRFYDKLFDKLGIKNEPRSVNKIVNSNFELFNKYFHIDREINIQYGGEKIIYKFEGYTFYVYKVEESDRVTFSIHNNSSEDSSEMCMILIIVKKENFGYIENISYHQNCALGGLPKTKGGSMMLRATLNFINKIKDKYNLEYIQLKDNSHFYCTQDKSDLSSLYMLTRGTTWYAKYGFIPWNPYSKKIDIETYADLKANGRLVKLILVKYTNLEKYIINAIKEIGLEKDFPSIKINKIMNEYRDKSIQEFFEMFIRKYDVTCDIFNKIYKKLIKDIGIVNLHGKTYYKSLVREKDMQHY